MAETFYPFVENGAEGGATPETTLVVRHSARIAVFDDPSAAPRVVVVEPTDIRSYLEQITKTVTQLAQEQGGKIPFTVIREVVENLIHAYFMEPTVSILDGGNTIRFSDQGPGIADKDRALEFGTTSATTEMKRYIRGVGSGLPYAQQWLEDKGGSLSVEDNIHQGTVVTISLAGPSHGSPAAPIDSVGANQAIYQQQQASTPQMGYPQQAYPPAQQPYPAATPAWQGYPQQAWAAQAYPQQSYPPQPYQQAPLPATGYPQTPWPQPGSAYPQQGYQSVPSGYPPQVAPGGSLNDRSLMALDYLRTHESVGPRDLNALHPLSESTWSRVLAQLEDQGLVSKQGGQKRHLTALGRQYLGM